MTKGEGFKKKTVTLLVILAVILAVLSISLRVMDVGEKVSTESSGAGEASGGEVGVTVLPPEVEDLGGEPEVPNEA